MRRETVLAIWIGGLILAVALYFIGPDRFFDACLALIDAVNMSFRNVIAMLGVQAYAVIRALAIAIYIVFVVLAFLASQRGHRGLTALLVVTTVFLVLVWRPYDHYPAPIGRWAAALILAVVGAVVMTQRLTAGPPDRR